MDEQGRTPVKRLALRGEHPVSGKAHRLALGLDAHRVVRHGVRGGSDPQHAVLPGELSVEAAELQREGELLPQRGIARFEQSLEFRDERSMAADEQRFLPAVHEHPDEQRWQPEGMIRMLVGEVDEVDVVLVGDTAPELLHRGEAAVQEDISVWRLHEQRGVRQALVHRFSDADVADSHFRR